MKVVPPLDTNEEGAEHDPAAEPQISTDPIVVKGVIPYEISFVETKEGPAFDLKFSNSAPAQMLAMEQVLGMINKIIESEMELLKQQRTLPKAQQKSLQRFTDTAFKKICNIMPFMEQWRNELMMEVFQRAKAEMPENQPGYEPPQAELSEFEVWLGRTATDDAVYYGTHKGFTFKEACKAALVEYGEMLDDYNEQRNTYLARNFFQSEELAQQIS